MGRSLPTSRSLVKGVNCLRACSGRLLSARNGILRPMTSPDANGPRGPIERITSGFAEQLLAAGIDGHAKLPSAAVAAEREIARGGDHNAVVSRIVNKHTRLAGVEGFVTGLGGIVTLPIAIPANIAGFYIIATRMTASIAAASGYDVDDPGTRSAILLCLSGQDANDILRTVGLGTGTTRLATHALAGLPPSVLMIVNKGVAFRIVTGLGRRSLAWLGRGVPLAGGAIGAGLDAMLIRRIAKVAREQFPPIVRTTSTVSAQEAQGS